MTTYQWFFILNAVEFAATGLVSRTLSIILEGLGQKQILVTKANYLALTFEGIFLPLQLNGKNPFEFEDHAAYIDENNNVWLGIKIDEN